MRKRLWQSEADIDRSFLEEELEQDRELYKAPGRILAALLAFFGVFDILGSVGFLLEARINKQ